VRASPPTFNKDTKNYLQSQAFPQIFFTNIVFFLEKLPAE
jgi:hypothetical protein